MKRPAKWVIVLVAFDDLEIDAQVLAERIPANDNEHIAAFMRGGEVLDVLSGEYDEASIEGYRMEFERKCLR